MPGFQQIIIAGHVGRDPELRYTPDGVAVCDFSVAVTEKWTKDGERREKTTWFKVTVWRKHAEVCNQYVTTGMAVLVVGTVDSSAYLDKKSGEPRSSLELTAKTVKFLGGGRERDDAGDQHTGDSDDLPF